LKDRTGGLLALADEDDLRIKIRRQVAALQSDGVDVELVMRRTHDTRQQRSPCPPSWLVCTRSTDVVLDCGVAALGGKR